MKSTDKRIHENERKNLVRRPNTCLIEVPQGEKE